jgi:hypothetical protein
MTSQTFDDNDQAFDQRLLGAGRAEALPHERTEAALLRFSTGLAALQGGLVGAALAPPVAAANGSTWSRFLSTAKWVALGAVAGGVATFLWVQHAGPRSPSSAPATPSVIERAAAAAAISQPRAAMPSEQPAALVPPADSQTPRAARATAAPSARHAKTSSDLAAEVAALDGVRTALAIGAWSDAEQQLNRYRRNFATGALRTEAEVLTIETLRAQGRQEAAAGAAQRFIAQHPRDPQVARVRALTE